MLLVTELLQELREEVADRQEHQPHLSVQPRADEVLEGDVGLLFLGPQYVTPRHLEEDVHLEEFPDTGQEPALRQTLPLLRVLKRHPDLQWGEQQEPTHHHGHRLHLLSDPQGVRLD